MKLALLHNSARLLDVSLREIYQADSRYARHEIQTLIEGYFNGGEQNLASFGYCESSENGEFSYKRCW
jgi:hypothetical protein